MFLGKIKNARNESSSLQLFSWFLTNTRKAQAELQNDNQCALLLLTCNPWVSVLGQAIFNNFNSRKIKGNDFAMRMYVHSYVTLWSRIENIDSALSMPTFSYRDIVWTRRSGFQFEIAQTCYIRPFNLAPIAYSHQIFIYAVLASLKLMLLHSRKQKMF